MLTCRLDYPESGIDLNTYILAAVADLMLGNISFLINFLNLKGKSKYI